MRIRILTRIALLVALTSRVLSIKDASDAAGLLGRRTDSLDDMVRRRTEEMTSGHLVARMPQPPPAAPSQSAAANLTGSDPSTLDQAQVNSMIAAACTKALAPIKDVSNDAGFLGCYNIPFLNTNTGVFEADLRLYQRSQPSGAFAGVKPSDISVQLSYQNAAFSTVSQGKETTKRELDLEVRQDAGALSELQDFWFVGQVSRTLSLAKLKDMDLMALLIPSIQLSVDIGSGPKASTTLTSASMIFFVSGIFEGQSASGAAAAVPTAAAAAAAKAAAFSLPGTTLGIFPVGLVITSIWALLFFAVVGYGTWERIQFRNQFRQRKERAAAAGRS